MTERLTKCASCGSTDIETLALFNPETTDMNCKAMLRCNACSLVFEGKVTSPHCEKERERGWIL
jgi:uncharacterized Zn finger protein